MSERQPPPGVGRSIARCSRASLPASFSPSALTSCCIQSMSSRRGASQCPTRFSCLRPPIGRSTASRQATSLHGSRLIGQCSTRLRAALWDLSCALWVRQ
jgi:hypothetical protein